MLACYAVCLLCRPLSGESESSYSDSEAEMEVTDVRILYVIIISTVYLYQVSVSYGCIHNDFFKVCAYIIIPLCIHIHYVMYIFSVVSN